MRISRLGMLVAVVLSVSVSESLGAPVAIVPPGEHARIHALMAPYDYFPSKLPAGLIYIKWTSGQPAQLPSVCGEVLSITFAAAGGKEVDWSSSRDCDSQGRVGCFTTGYPGYALGMLVNRRATISGRRVFFSRGNHGSNAWACIPANLGGVKDMVVVGIWESNFMSAASAMQLVAHAHH